MAVSGQQHKDSSIRTMASGWWHQDGGIRIPASGHRHQDGSHDELTMYGGISADPATGLAQHFPADAYSKLMFQALGRTAAPANVWSFTLEPGKTLIYRLSRPGREFAVAFELTRPVALPPPAWGAVDRVL